MIAIRSLAMTLVSPGTILLLGARCTSGLNLLGDGDHDVGPPTDADGAADADAHADADGDVDVLAESEVSCCGPDDPMVAACQDGRWCNGPEQVDCSCECVPPGDLIDCDDGDPATVDWCDETMDVCRHSDDGGDADADAEADVEAVGDADACDGVWQDPTTGYLWQDPPPTDLMGWEAAIHYCDDLTLCGLPAGAWHLPTISESRTLIQGCPATVSTSSDCPATDLCVTCGDVVCAGCGYAGGPGVGGCYWDPSLGGNCYRVPFWSSSTPNPGTAWDVFFSRGAVVRQEIVATELVRCVRPGP